MEMVVGCLGGTAPLVTCLDDLKNWGIYASCTQHQVWSVVNETTRNILDSTSIKDLLSRVAAAKLRMAVATA